MICELSIRKQMVSKATSSDLSYKIYGETT